MGLIGTCYKAHIHAQQRPYFLAYSAHTALKWLNFPRAMLYLVGAQTYLAIQTRNYLLCQESQTKSWQAQTTQLLEQYSVHVGHWGFEIMTTCLQGRLSKPLCSSISYEDTTTPPVTRG